MRYHEQNNHNTRGKDRSLEQQKAVRSRGNGRQILEGKDAAGGVWFGDGWRRNETGRTRDTRNTYAVKLAL
jgi:hypothetical protein